MTGNWVERKMGREKCLREQAPKVWDAARAAIQSACESFNRIGSKNGSTVDIERQNGHCLVAAVRFKREKSADSEMRRVSVEFDERKSSIFVTLNGAKPQEFAVRADDAHCFIEFKGKEIDADSFSEFALKEALYEDELLS